MVMQGLFGDLVDPDPAHAAGGLVEIPPDEIFIQADRLEDLSAAITIGSC